MRPASRAGPLIGNGSWPYGKPNSGLAVSKQAAPYARKPFRSCVNESIHKAYLNRAEAMPATPLKIAPGELATALG